MRSAKDAARARSHPIAYVASAWMRIAGAGAFFCVVGDAFSPSLFPGTPTARFLTVIGTATLYAAQEWFWATRTHPEPLVKLGIKKNADR